MELNQKGYVNAIDFCETHNISAATILKDLNFLENEKLLHRILCRASKQPIYSFEKDVRDKDTGRAKKGSSKRSIKIYK
jgi:DeoR family transcriptional regulator of aga operon